MFDVAGRKQMLTLEEQEEYEFQKFLKSVNTQLGKLYHLVNNDIRKRYGDDLRVKTQELFFALMRLAISLDKNNYRRVGILDLYSIQLPELQKVMLDYANLSEQEMHDKLFRYLTVLEEKANSLKASFDRTKSDAMEIKLNALIRCAGDIPTSDESY